MLGNTKMCRFFAKGKCKRGKQCSFAHNEADLKAQPDFSKTQLCAEMTQHGSCSRGAECLYAHSTQELRRSRAPLPPGAVGQFATCRAAAGRCSGSRSEAHKAALPTAPAGKSAPAMPARPEPPAWADPLAAPRPLRLQRWPRPSGAAAPKPRMPRSGSPGPGPASPFRGLHDVRCSFSRQSTAEASPRSSWDDSASEAPTPTHSASEEEVAIYVEFIVKNTFMSLVPFGSPEQRRGRAASAPPGRG